jgi:hypothetical protein
MEVRHKSRFPLVARVIVVLLLAAMPVLAQPQGPPTPVPPDKQTADDKPNKQTANDKKDKQTADDKKDGNQQTVGSNDRLFYALPNFQTVETTEQLPPLTTGQKFKLQARSQFDYVEIPWYGILAGFSQARNTSAGYGQGAAGYGKRYASEWGDGTIENFMVGAVFASALRQDPRYYVLGRGSFWHRAGYAVSRIVVTRSDSGRTEFNTSQVFGAAVAAGISTYSYHPRDERTLRNTASVWGTQIGLDTFTQGVKEFWPDFHRRFSRKRQHPSTP